MKEEEGEKKGLKAFIEKHYVLTEKDGGYIESKARAPLKVGADLGAVAIGTVGGLLPNKLSFGIGIGLVVLGRLMKDPTGLVAIAGSSMIGYSVAMAKESEQTEETAIDGITLGSVKKGVKAKFSRLKENWLHATYLNKVLGNKDQEEESTENTESTTETVGSIGAVDLSALDELEQMVEESAVNAEIKKIREEEQDNLFVHFENDFQEKEEPIEMEQISGFDDDEFDHFRMATM